MNNSIHLTTWLFPRSGQASLRSVSLWMITLSLFPLFNAVAGEKDQERTHEQQVVDTVKQAMASPSRQLKFEKTDYGRITINAGPVRMEFPFTNPGPKVIKIKEVKPLFTTAVTTTFKDGKNEYAPGESGVLQVTYDPAKETNTWYFKELWLVCEGDVDKMHINVFFGIPPT